MYVWLIHFAIQQKLTQHCKLAILQRKLKKKKKKRKVLLPCMEFACGLGRLQTWMVILLFCLQYWRPRFDPWVGKIPWRRKSLLIPVFWPGEFHGLYSLWDHKESDMTEWLSLPLHFPSNSSSLKKYLEVYLFEINKFQKLFFLL